jgi:hypothetical protein
MAGLAVTAAPGVGTLTRYVVDQLAHSVVLDVSKAMAQGWRPRHVLDDFLAVLRAGR